MVHHVKGHSSQDAFRAGMVLSGGLERPADPVRPIIARAVVQTLPPEPGRFVPVFDHRASYEAKAFGVKTGTRVADARRMCPGITFLPSRHRLYVRFNLAVGTVLDRYAELTHVRSVDEFQLALSGEAQSLDGARSLVQTLKAAVASEVGSCIRFSAGVGPNHLLAKLAGKLEKPDGFQWLGPENMPDAISHLALDDLPGIQAP